MSQNRFLGICLGLSGFIATSVMASALPSDQPGNRYDLPRLYHSEISAAKSYLLTSHDRGNKYKDEFANAVIIDVRRVSEHLAGHPPGAYSIPFPHINGSPACANDDGVIPCPDKNKGSGYIGYDVSVNEYTGFGDRTDPDFEDEFKDGVLDIEDFVSYVESVFPDKSTPILTLCATGYRSVQAANALTQAGYMNVRNIWEGYNGQQKYAYIGNTILLDDKGNPIPLDLNRDTRVDGEDRDGWAYFQGLPVETKIHPQRIFHPYSDLYEQ